MGAATAARVKPARQSQRAPEWAKEYTDLKSAHGYFAVWNWFFDIAPRKLVPSVRDVVGQILRRTNGAPSPVRDNDRRCRWALLSEVDLCAALILSPQAIREVFASCAEDMTRSDTWESVCDRMSDAAARNPLHARFIIARKVGRSNYYALHPDAGKLLDGLADRVERTRVPKKGPDVEEEFDASEDDQQADAEDTRRVFEGRNLYSDRGIRFRSASKSTPVAIPPKAKELEVEVHDAPGSVFVRVENAGATQRVHVDVEKPRETKSKTDKPFTETKEVTRTIPLPGWRYSEFKQALVQHLNGNGPVLNDDELRPEFDRLMSVGGKVMIQLLSDRVRDAHKRGNEFRTGKFAPHLVGDACRDAAKYFDIALSGLEVRDGAGSAAMDEFDAWCAERKIPTATGGEFIAAAERYARESGRHL